MRTSMIAAVAGAAALVAGLVPAMAEDGPLRPQDIAGVQSVSGGSDLRLPGSGSVSDTRGNSYRFHCDNAKNEAVPNNPNVTMWCAPGDR